MAGPAYQFEIITLEGKAFSGSVTSLVLPGEEGSFGVWANHASLISTCVPGKLKLREESGSEQFFLTQNGFFEVVKNRAIFLTTSAEKSEIS